MWGSVGVVTLAALVSVLWIRVTTSGRLWLIVGLVAGCLEVWLEFRVSARFTLAWYLGNMAGLVVSLAMLISLLYEITQICGELAASNAMLEKLVQLDALTELFNRRGFEARLQEEFRRARRLHLPLSVVMVDIDFFRSFNDRYGHQLGDECLRRVSSAIKAALWRPGDHAARYGGDVIAILLPSTDLLGAIMIGQRVRSAVAELALPHVGGPWQTVTVSAGVGSMLPQDASHSAADLLAAAEHALNQAKQEGRNRICVGTADLVAITQQDRPALASQEV
jgi:diguanylate cyclase (GGDEF)-like protein